ncbi:hypothetical protein PS2_036535 [Malus domestica]
MDPMNTRKFISLSEQPQAPKACNFSLSFLPCYQGPVKSQDYEPVVLWDALPPPPQCHEEICVGFICENKECKEDDKPNKRRKWW